MRRRRPVALGLAAGVMAASAAPPPVAPGDVPDKAQHGWRERWSGTPLDLTGSTRIYAEEFRQPLTLAGPVLWAAQHADTGLAHFDPPGGAAYRIANGVLSLTAYQKDGVIHGANVQSTNAQQAYAGAPIVPGKLGFTCAGCYWEARLRFPRAYGTWGGLWLLTPDDPQARGHLEIDGIEYYGRGDARGHHHTLHRWRPADQGGHVQWADYTGMDALADFGWHTHGIDLRGRATVDGRKAVVITMDGREVARYPADPDVFTKPFYVLLTLSINARDPRHTLPQTMEAGYIRAWHDR